MTDLSKLHPIDAALLDTIAKWEANYREARHAFLNPPENPPANWEPVRLPQTPMGVRMHGAIGGDINSPEIARKIQWFHDYDRWLATWDGLPPPAPLGDAVE